MKRMKKILAGILALCLCVSLLAGCSGNLQSEDDKKRFVLGDTTFNPENSEPDVNPHNEYAGWACIRYGIGETLFRYSDAMELEPWLATGYERLDEMTWNITLREDVSFTSGRKMDGDAVRECLLDLIEQLPRAAGDLCIDCITAEGQNITIRTTEPKPALLNYLSDPYGCIFDVSAGIQDGIVQATGPYQAVSLVSGSRLDLVKNEDYWNGEPKIDEITVLTISDGDTLTMALQSGEIDAAYGMPYASYPIFENDAYTFSSTATSRTFYACMNFESSVTSDPAVRKAIAMGIDKEGFVDVLLDGYGEQAVGAFPDSLSFGGDTVTTETYDPEEAAKILTDAGWVDTDGDGIREKDGTALEIRWLTYPTRQELPLLAESAQATLKEIGISVVINSTADHKSFLADPAAWDVYSAAMVTAPTGDPEYFFTSCCLGDAAVNRGGYHSDRLEELGTQMATEFDPVQRAALAVEMQQILLDDHAYVFCSHLRMSLISKSNVIGLTAHPCDYYEISVDLDVNPKA